MQCMVSCLSHSACCHFSLCRFKSETAVSRCDVGKSHSNGIWGLYTNTMPLHVLFCRLGLALGLFFLSLSLALTGLPLPALNKDNYSGNTLANEERPCILPVGEAASQDPANITQARSPCLKSGAFPRLRAESVLHVL